MLRLVLIFFMCSGYMSLDMAHDEMLSSERKEKSFWSDATEVIKRPILNKRDTKELLSGAQELNLELDLYSQYKMIDLRKYDVAMKNQGSRGWCTSFSAVAAMENMVSQSGLDWVLSEKDLWRKYRAYDLYKAANAAVKFQTRLEKYIPYYGWKKKGWQNSDRARLSRVTNVMHLDHILDTLERRKPVLAAMEVTSYWGNPRLGLIPSRGRVNGGHAVTFVGYYRGEQSFFVFKNSWGKEWGDSGYGYLPFDYCVKFSCYFIATDGVSIN
jgi:C1A family cysteine protease